MPTRRELQELSEVRLLTAKALFEKGFYDQVCENSGYVIEFGLKSAVCKYINENEYPEEDKRYREHSLTKLVNLANLHDELMLKKKDRNFYVNWSLISRWSVNFRYAPIGTRGKDIASDYVNAVEHPKDGVYPWVKKNW